jgi:hypothetical protein
MDRVRKQLWLKPSQQARGGVSLCAWLGFLAGRARAGLQFLQVRTTDAKYGQPERAQVRQLDAVAHLTLQELYMSGDALGIEIMPPRLANLKLTAQSCSIHT